MKKIYNYLFVGIVGMLCMTLSSCNNDDNIARDLDGVWAGDVTVGNWRNHEFQYVEIEFFKNPYRYAKGTGVEYDYSDDGWFCYVCEFSYEVDDRVIYIDYADDTHVRICDYDLYGNIFRGEFRNSYDRKIAGFTFARPWNYRYSGGRYKVYRWNNGNYSYSLDVDFEEESKTNKTEAEKK